MERLTEKHYRAEDYYLLCSADCDADMDCVDCPAFERAVDRLGAYENTGLTPELIEELLADATAMREETKWISTRDPLPEVGKIVQVHQIYSWERGEDGAAVTIGRLRPVPEGQKPFWEFQHYRPDFRSGCVMDNDIICPGSEYVTHWKPLPEPPGKPGIRKPYEPPRAEIIMEGGQHEQITGAALGAGAEPAGSERKAEGDRPAHGRGNGEPV